MRRSCFVIISLILFIAELIAIFGSVSWGSEAASAYVGAHGGSIDVTQFTIILQNPSTYTDGLEAFCRLLVAWALLRQLA